MDFVNYNLLIFQETIILDANGSLKSQFSPHYFCPTLTIKENWEPKFEKETPNNFRRLLVKEKEKETLLL